MGSRTLGPEVAGLIPIGAVAVPMWWNPARWGQRLVIGSPLAIGDFQFQVRLDRLSLWGDESFKSRGIGTDGSRYVRRRFDNSSRLESMVRAVGTLYPGRSAHPVPGHFPVSQTHFVVGGSTTFQHQNEHLIISAVIRRLSSGCLCNNYFVFFHSRFY